MVLKNALEKQIRLETLLESEDYLRIQHWASLIAEFEGTAITTDILSEAIMYTLTPECLCYITKINSPSHRIERARTLGVEITDDPEPWRTRCLDLIQSLPSNTRKTIFSDIVERTCIETDPILNYRVFPTAQLKAMVAMITSIQKDICEIHLS